MRIKSKLWVQAYLRRCEADLASAVITSRGDEDAGAIYLKILHLDGNACLYAPAPAGFAEVAVERRWIAAIPDQPKPETEIDASLARTREFDPDIWIIEVEDRNGNHRLGDELVSDESP